MIGKSMRRKGGAGVHFKQLYDYLMKHAEGERYFRNFLDYEPNRERVIKLFEQNARLMKLSNKRNVLYHEVISLGGKGLSKDHLATQEQALRHLVDKYIKVRSPDSLCMAVVHLNTDHPHAHIMFSANNVGEAKRVRLERAVFNQIKRDLESELQRTFPELNEPTIQNRELTSPEKISEKEYQLKKRTKQPSKRDLLRSTLEYVFTAQKTQEDAQHVLLHDYGIELIQRGKNMSVKQGNMRCRLKSLEVDQLYRDIGNPMNDLRRTWVEADKKQERDQGLER